MTQTTPADELRAAEERVRMGDRRIDISLRGQVTELFKTAADMVTAYPQMGDAHDRQVCDDFACDLVGHALAVARVLNGGAR